MFNAVILCVMAAIVFWLSAWVKKGTREIENESKIKTTAIISDVAIVDGGDAMYYVTFLENGKPITAQSIYYSFCTPTLKIGEEVEIAYYYAKGGRAYAMILNQNLVPCLSSTKNFCRCLTAMGIVFLVLAGYLFVKNLGA